MWNSTPVDVNTVLMQRTKMFSSNTVRSAILGGMSQYFRHGIVHVAAAEVTPHSVFATQTCQPVECTSPLTSG